jgi:hypothetical protein
MPTRALGRAHAATCNEAVQGRGVPCAQRSWSMQSSFIELCFRRNRATALYLKAHASCLGTAHMEMIGIHGGSWRVLRASRCHCQVRNPPVGWRGRSGRVIGRRSAVGIGRSLTFWGRTVPWSPPWWGARCRTPAAPHRPGGTAPASAQQASPPPRAARRFVV